MSNIEIPEEVKVAAQRVVAGRECYIATTVAMAEFVLGLNKPEIKVEPFVIYKVEVKGDNEHRMGFRVARNVPSPWVTLNSNSPNKEYAFGLTMESLIHSDEEVKVIERWSPEAPETKFGIGEAYADVDREREVLVKGVLGSESVDRDGDVLVQMKFSQDLTESHYVNAADIAYAEENNGD